jgi:hypothetical protein
MGRVLPKNNFISYKRVRKENNRALAVLNETFALPELSTCQAVLNSCVSKAVWFFQVDVLSVIKPRNFVCKMFGIVLLPYLIFLQVSMLFLVINWMYCVFLKFRENKFALNHLFEISKTLWLLILKLVGFECMNNIMV